LATPDDRRRANELLDDTRACFSGRANQHAVVINGCDTGAAPEGADISGCTNTTRGARTFRNEPGWRSQFQAEELQEQHSNTPGLV